MMRSSPLAGGTVSVVIPSRNRAAALAHTLPHLLEVRGVDEVVVVLDGGTDHSASVLSGLGDDRIAVVEQATTGVHRARLTGACRAVGDWLLFIDDDDLVPLDHIEAVGAVARAEAADLVGSPWIFTNGDDDVEAVAAARRRTRIEKVRLDKDVGLFPKHNLATPFLPPAALVRADVFRALDFEAGYRGNFWREETDLWVQVVRGGGRAVLTPDTYSYQVRRFAGGIPRRRWWYEAWTVRNDQLFMRRHGTWLYQQGHLEHRPLIKHLSLVGRRAGHAGRAQLATMARSATRNG